MWVQFSNSITFLRYAGKASACTIAGQSLSGVAFHAKISKRSKGERPESLFCNVIHYNFCLLAKFYSIMLENSHEIPRTALCWWLFSICIFGRIVFKSRWPLSAWHIVSRYVILNIAACGVIFDSAYQQQFLIAFLTVYITGFIFVPSERVPLLWNQQQFCFLRCLQKLLFC